jgi:hypothetical protein
MVSKVKRDRIVLRLIKRMERHGGRIVGITHPAERGLDDDGMDIPCQFLTTMISSDELWEAVVFSHFDADLCRRLWQFLGRTDEPPEMLHLGGVDRVQH